MLVEPIYFQAKQLPEDIVELSWQNRAPEVWSFTIERKTNNDDYKKIANVTATVSFWKDETILIGDTYQYRIKATAGPEESIYAESNVITISGTKLSAPKDLIAKVETNFIYLEWQNTDNRVESFRVFRSEDGQNAILTNTTTVCKVVDSSIFEGREYTYYVIAVYKHNLSNPIRVNVVTLLKAPSNISIKILSDDEIKFAWQNNSSKVEEYEIQRAPLNSENFSVVAYTKQNWFVDDSKMSWCYRIRAYKNFVSGIVYSPPLEIAYSSPYAKIIKN